ncbi:MAG: hypothetical protein COV47_03600 [Candidatus Diapherotrites archaeon CG11_big_fil_rev_8_21_14_0_20_37_9]|nr:MAG: hypothetical protein COV47_03600 [Candidatus Diapherotrites archaeon CG11_big_fil_rev_8_21_14_0_20_37_9]
MNKQIYFYATAIIAVLVILLAVFIFTNLDFSEYKYSVVKDGIEFVSNVDEPQILFGELRGYDSFIISPAFVQQGPENSFMATPLVLYSTLFVAKQKGLISVARVVENGSVVECQSNLGDFKTNKVLTTADCQQLLDDPFYAKVFIEMPDASLERPRVILEHGNVKIIPHSFDSVAGVSFTVAENIYPDAKSVIGEVNDLLGRVQR